MQTVEPLWQAIVKIQNIIKYANKQLISQQVEAGQHMLIQVDTAGNGSCCHTDKT